MFSPLSDKRYARLFSAQVIALLGTGLTTVALALLAFDLAGDEAGQVLGTALAIKIVAFMVLAPIAGTIAQQVPRRAFLVVLDVARAAIVLCLPFVTQVWQIYGIIFLLQACSAGFTPVFQATIPDILDDEAEYTKALSLSRLAYDIENLLSPTLAAAALLVMSFNGMFVANAFAFCASALLVLTVSIPAAATQTRDGSWFARVTFGTRAYLTTPRLRGLFSMSMAVAAAGAMIIVNTVVYVRAHLGLGDQWTAVMLAAFGAGSMVAAFAAPSLLSRYNDRTVATTSGVLMAASLALGTLMPGFILAMGLWCMIGMGYSAVLVIAGRLLQRSASREDRPAYFAAQFSLSHACWLITYPLAGWLGSAYGLPTAFFVLCLLVIIATVAALVVWPAKDERALVHTHEALDHGHLHVHDEHHQHDHEGWEGPEPHSHPHRHAPVRHSHDFVIDRHHHKWPA